ncbi:MAG: response regulator [Janthinobacterium lividum]
MGNDGQRKFSQTMDHERPSPVNGLITHVNWFLRVMCHVLIIEDEPLIAILLQDILEEAGATSFSFAVTEQEAVDLAEQQVPAVIASDVNLLEGTGPKAVQRIHMNQGAIPVIFITATPEACQVCNPATVVLMKPVNIRELTATFHKLAPA